MHCTNCANHDIVEIHLTIADEAVAFQRCPRCDSRSWSGPGGEMSKDGVLELVRAGR